MDIIHKEARTILTAASGFVLGGFTHTLNPYSGCAFGQQVGELQGCPFCYVRRSPVGLFGRAAWGDWVTVKTNAPTLLEKELRSLRRRGKPIRILMSSSTDPFQGVERTEQITRRCLEVMVAHPPDFVLVQTRSLLVKECLDLIAALGDRAMLSLSLETNREDVRKIFTPTSPPVKARLEVARTFKQAGIPVQIAIAPLLPHDPELFAEAVAPVVDRVVVDTLFEGDGAGGTRSESLGMRELFTQHGFSEFYRPDAHLPLMAELRRRLGPERVHFSAEGFNTAPH